MVEHLEEARRAGLLIVNFQEMRMLGIGTREVTVRDSDGKDVTWHLYWSGYKTRKVAGVCTAVRKSKYVKVHDWAGLSARVMWMQLFVHSIKITVVIPRRLRQQ